MQKIFSANKKKWKMNPKKLWIKQFGCDSIKGKMKNNETTKKETRTKQQ